MIGDRIIFAARAYTEYRRPDGSTYVEKHPPKPKPRIKREDRRQWWRNRK